MKQWTSFIKNKFLLIIGLIIILSVIIGTYFYQNINIDLNFINLTSVIKNNAIMHIFFVLIIFFLSFVFVGSFIGLLILIYEITCIVILGLILISSLNLYGLLICLVLLIFKVGYLFLLIYLIIKSFKISQNFLAKRFNNEKTNIYIKQTIFASLIIILIEIFNFFIGYKLIGFFAF